jgi:hypothetical protein
MHRSAPFAIAAMLLMSLTAGAEAGVRNYFSPKLEGTRIDACMAEGGCGKPVADAFCKTQGYDKALIFQREAFQSTRVLDSGETCTASCTAFKQIKCFTTKDDFAGL